MHKTNTFRKGKTNVSAQEIQNGGIGDLISGRTSCAHRAFNFKALRLTRSFRNGLRWDEGHGCGQTQPDNASF